MDFNSNEKSLIKEALTEELAFLEEENLPREEGKIGIESLDDGEGYAYAAMGGYGNMASYITVEEAIAIASS
jgi:uncharacterized protein (DUF885 family)